MEVIMKKERNELDREAKKVGAGWYVIWYTPSVYKQCNEGKKDMEVIYVGSTTNLQRRMQQHKHCVNNLESKAAKANKALYEFLAENEGEYMVCCYEAKDIDYAKSMERYEINKHHPCFNRDRVQSTSPLGLVSTKEDYNKYHRDYLQKNREYNAEHAEYCRNYYQTHKDYFKKKYAEYRARKEGK
jgi:hypothetical protein